MTGIAQAHYLRGDAYLGLSQWSDAITDFQAYLALRPGLIDSYAYERIGDAQLALGRRTDALASYGQAAATPAATLVPLLALRERVAQVDATAGRHRRRRRAVRRNPARWRRTRRTAPRSRCRRRRRLIDAGDLQNGLVRMMQVFTDYPDRPEAYQAMNVLLSNSVDARRSGARAGQLQLRRLSGRD